MMNKQQKETKSLLTIVIPTNRSQFLDEAINSVLMQKEVSCELIVVDDGATLPIEPVISLKFPEVKFIRHQRNLGLPAARNTGVVNAKTKYITFLDCDDQLEIGFAQEMISACERTNSKVAVCLPHFFFSPAFPLRRMILFFCLGIIRDIVILASYIFNNKQLPKNGFFLVQSSHVMFERELLLKFPSDEKYLTAANDWKLMAQILEKEKVAILPKKLSRYRYHYNSQTQSKNKIPKWIYYDQMLKEIPDICKRGLLVSLFKFYNNLGKSLIFFLK